MADYSNELSDVFKFKILLFLLGAAVGMLVVWVAFQWVPGAVVNALDVVAG